MKKISSLFKERLQQARKTQVKEMSFAD